MRYKIKAPDEDTFDKAKESLSKEVLIRLESKRRLMFTVDDLPASLISELESQGLNVAEDVQYELD